MATNMFKDLFTLPDFMLFDNNHDMRLNFNSKVPLNNFKGKTKQNKTENLTLQPCFTA